METIHLPVDQLCAVRRTSGQGLFYFCSCWPTRMQIKSAEETDSYKFFISIRVLLPKVDQSGFVNILPWKASPSQFTLLPRFFFYPPPLPEHFLRFSWQFTSTHSDLYPWVKRSTTKLKFNAYERNTMKGRTQTCSSRVQQVNYQKFVPTLLQSAEVNFIPH